MPIKPRHTPSEGRPVAQRQFTDREDFIKTFRTALAAERREQPTVLVYYGVGGIGKTSLRRELRRLIAEPDGTVSAVLDFETPGYRDMETALFALRKALLNDFKVHFPTFDIAYAVYWQKSRPQTAMTGENLPLLQDSMVLSDLLAAVGVVPIIGVIPRLPYLFAKGRKVLQDWWTRRGSEELKGLPSLEPPQIAERLPMFWASDLRDFLAAKGSKAVLFLDTYDALSESERVEGKLREREAWLRELVAQLPEVLWVICGREQLRWAEADQEWAGCLEQHLVGGLAESDARQFLRSCGVRDWTIQRMIVESSQGVPYFLDLAVDTWSEIRERQKRVPKPEDFAHTRMEMFDRFLRHLTHPEVETLKVLSVPRFWDYPLCETLVTKFQTGFPLTAFTDLCRFSFVAESTPGGTYTMHQLMRQSLQEHESPELVKRVHRFLFELYDGRLKEIDVRNVTDRQKAALAEAFYHGRALLPVQGFLQWFQKPAEQFYAAAQYRMLLPLREQLVDDIDAELGPEHPDVAVNLHGLADVLQNQGRHREAEHMLRRALAIREKALGPEHPDVASSLNELAACVAYPAGKHAEAEEMLRRALNIQEKALGPEHAGVASSLSFVAIVLAKQGKTDEAERLARRAVDIAEKTLGTEHVGTAWMLNCLGLVLGAQGKYADAEHLHRRALAIGEKALGPENPGVVDYVHNLGGALVDQGRHAEAEPLLRRALTMLESACGPDSVNVANTLAQLARLYDQTGRTAEAEQIRARLKAIREKNQQSQSLPIKAK
jgi:tetratricopeptide (TPR) repeat protein